MIGVSVKMMLFGFNLPLWAVFIGGIIVVYIAWKILKFAVKILFILIAFFGILFGVDLLNSLGVFEWIQNLFSSFL